MSKEMEKLGVTVDANSMSFGNIVNAISVMQEHMGIAGTTSAEAGRTIEGSVNAMKSAWSNLLTGFGDSSANIEDLVRNLMTTLVGNGTEENLGVLGNVLPAVNNIISGVVDAMPLLLNGIISYLPYLIDAGAELIMALVLGIQDNLPAVMSSITTVLNTLTSALIEGLPEILKIGMEIILSLVQGLAEQLPSLIPQMVDTVVLMVDTLIDNIDLIIDAGIQLIIGLAEGLIEALPRLIDKIPVIIDKLVDAIIRNLPKIIEMGITLTVKLAEGLVKAIPQLVGKIPEIMGSFIKGFGSFLNNDLKELGKNIIKGIINGLTSCGDIIWKAIKSVGNSMLDGIKSFFGIKSPSTLFRDQVGKNLALGLGEGFEDEMKEVTSDMQDALPTSLNTDLSVGSSTALSTNNYLNMVEAFKEALTQVKIELDDEVAGRFVETTVTNAIYN